MNPTTEQKEAEHTVVLPVYWRTGRDAVHDELKDVILRRQERRTHKSIACAKEFVKWFFQEQQISGQQQQKIYKLMRKIKALNKELQELQHIVMGVEQQNEDLEEENYDLRVNIKALHKEVRKLQYNVMDVEQENDDLKIEIKELKQEVAEYQEVLNDTMHYESELASSQSENPRPRKRRRLTCSSDSFSGWSSCQD